MTLRARIAYPVVACLVAIVIVMISMNEAEKKEQKEHPRPTVSTSQR